MRLICPGNANSRPVDVFGGSFVRFAGFSIDGKGTAPEDFDCGRGRVHNELKLPGFGDRLGGEREMRSY